MLSIEIKRVFNENFQVYGVRKIWRQLLRDHGFVASMSGRGNCYDNAMVETVFKTIKSELIWRTAFATRDQASTAIGQYIEGLYISHADDTRASATSARQRSKRRMRGKWEEKALSTDKGEVQLQSRRCRRSAAQCSARPRRSHRATADHTPTAPRR
jgi:transposase InsO family protein